jgi:hypothetical protein
MRQWADLEATRRVLNDFGGRIVYVPRCKQINGESVWYLGVDMPMGDLSLLSEVYKSRMFLFADSSGRVLLIHDMKKPEQLSIYFQTLLRQLEDPFIVAATEELVNGKLVPFSKTSPSEPIYGAPTPEFES